jgi:hypothetical protein
VHHRAYGAVMAIHDYINLAREGTDVALDIQLEYVPAVEHFANHKNAQIFLMAGFKSPALAKPAISNAAWPATRKKKKQKNHRQGKLPMTD